jgi:hypothetical protein
MAREGTNPSSLGLAWRRKRGRAQAAGAGDKDVSPEGLEVTGTTMADYGRVGEPAARDRTSSNTGGAGWR